MADIERESASSNRSLAISWDPKINAAASIKWSDELISSTLKKAYRTDAIHRGLLKLKADLAGVESGTQATLPPALGGIVLLPDGRPAARIAVEADRPNWAASETPAPWPRHVAITDETGRFSLKLPDAPVPDAGLTVSLRGADTFTSLVPKSADLVTGDIGTVTIDRPLSPLSDEAIKALHQDLETVDGTLDDFSLGEDDCARRFKSNAGVIDRFRWSSLIRLVEPQVYPKQSRVSTDRGDISAPEPGTMEALIYRNGAQRAGDRIPIGAPIDIDSFRRRLEAKPEDVPKAGSLALGYIVHMTQSWIPRGLSLGNLLYSLPLAPGEQQKMVVSKSQEQFNVREFESANL